MKTPKQLLTMALLLTAMLTSGQTTMPQTEEPPYIEVTGTAEKEVVPDQIFVEIVIREKYENRIKISIEEQEVKLRNSIKSLGIDLANLYLSDANADYVKVRWQKKDLLTKKEYTLKVSTATTVGQVFQELENLEITDASISKVSHSKLDSLRKEVKITAIKAAKDKADYLLAAIGEQTGKPLVIKENDISQTHTYSNVAIAVSNLNQNDEFYNVAGDLSKTGDNEIQFQKIKIQTSIYVKFSIQ